MTSLIPIISPDMTFIYFNVTDQDPILRGVLIIICDMANYKIPFGRLWGNCGKHCIAIKQNMCYYQKQF